MYVCILSACEFSRCLLRLSLVDRWQILVQIGYFVWFFFKFCIALESLVFIYLIFVYKYWQISCVVLLVYVHCWRYVASYVFPFSCHASSGPHYIFLQDCVESCCVMICIYCLEFNPLGCKVSSNIIYTSSNLNLLFYIFLCLLHISCHPLWYDSASIMFG